MLHRGIVRPSEVFAVQNYRTGVPVASNITRHYAPLPQADFSVSLASGEGDKSISGRLTVNPA